MKFFESSFLLPHNQDSTTMRTFRQPAKLTTRQRRQINAGRNGKRSIKVSGTTGSAREAPALLLLPNDDDNQPKAGSTGAKEKLSDDAKSLFNGKLVREMTDEDVEDNIRNDRFNIRQLREAASKRGLLVLGTKASLRDNLLLHFNGGAGRCSLLCFSFFYLLLYFTYPSYLPHL